MKTRYNKALYRMAHIISIQKLFARNPGHGLRVKEIQTLSENKVDVLLGLEYLAIAVKSNPSIFTCSSHEIETLETAIPAKVRVHLLFGLVQTVTGTGKIIGLTILPETGDIGRFARPWKYASYCRCVGSARFGNGKRKGRGKTRNGNKYLAWAFTEAAIFGGWALAERRWPVLSSVAPTATVA